MTLLQAVSFSNRQRLGLIWVAIAIAVCGWLLLVQVWAVDTLRLNESLLRQQAESQYGEVGVFVVNEWLSLIESVSELPVASQLEQVNDFFNSSVMWVDDIEHWGEADYWATPLETLATGAGDCEDYSIAKYVTLRLLGINEQALRLIYVNAQLSSGNQAHMVLGYYASPQATPLILDNINPDLLPAHQRSDLAPVFSFNSQGLWVGTQQASSADPTARLSRWRSVLNQMQGEGLQ